MTHGASDAVSIVLVTVTMVLMPLLLMSVRNFPMLNSLYFRFLTNCGFETGNFVNFLMTIPRWSELPAPITWTLFIFSGTLV